MPKYQMSSGPYGPIFYEPNVLRFICTENSTADNLKYGVHVHQKNET